MVEQTIVQIGHGFMVMVPLTIACLLVLGALYRCIK
jgi:hypothetical protein